VEIGLFANLGKNCITENHRRENNCIKLCRGKQVTYKQLQLYRKKNPCVYITKMMTLQNLYNNTQLSIFSHFIFEKYYHYSDALRDRWRVVNIEDC